MVAWTLLPPIMTLQQTMTMVRVHILQHRPVQLPQIVQTVVQEPQRHQQRPLAVQQHPAEQTHGLVW